MKLMKKLTDEEVDEMILEIDVDDTGILQAQSQDYLRPPARGPHPDRQTESLEDM